MQIVLNSINMIHHWHGSWRAAPSICHFTRLVFNSNVVAASVYYKNLLSGKWYFFGRLKSAYCVKFLNFSFSSHLLPHEINIPSDQWLLGGALGSRNAILVFKSSALANPTLGGSQDKPGHKLHITYKVSHLSFACSRSLERFYRCYKPKRNYCRNCWTATE